MRQALNHSYRFLRRAKSVRTLCIRLPKVVLFLFLLLGVGSLAAQNTDQQIAAQKRLIADLEKQIAREEQEISKLKKGRASAEETVRRLARQIDSRNQLLDVTERDARKLDIDFFHPVPCLRSALLQCPCASAVMMKAAEQHLPRRLRVNCTDFMNFMNFMNHAIIMVLYVTD